MYVRIHNISQFLVINTLSLKRKKKQIRTQHNTFHHTAKHNICFFLSKHTAQKKLDFISTNTYIHTQECNDTHSFPYITYLYIHISCSYRQTLLSYKHQSKCMYRYGCNNSCSGVLTKQTKMYVWRAKLIRK